MSESLEIPVRQLGELERDLLAFLQQKYVQRADTRQKEMGCNTWMPKLMILLRKWLASLKGEPKRPPEASGSIVERSAKITLLQALGRAVQAQRKAVYPGCELGFDHCLSQSCGCVEKCPSPMFLISRTRRILEETNASIEE